MRRGERRRRRKRDREGEGRAERNEKEKKKERGGGGGKERNIHRKSKKRKRKRKRKGRDEEKLSVKDEKNSSKQTSRHTYGQIDTQMVIRAAGCQSKTDKKKDSRLDRNNSEKYGF